MERTSETESNKEPAGSLKKFIFLDFDGVITTSKSGFKLDKKKLDLLGEIIRQTGAKLVISSSWKSYNVEETKKDLSSPGFYKPFPFPYIDDIVGVTIRGSQYVINKDNEPSMRICRGSEIENWLRTHVDEWYTDNFRYAILDDEDDILYSQRYNFVRTDTDTGLTKKHVKKAIQILNR